MARHVIDDSPEGLALLLGRDNGQHGSGSVEDHPPNGGEEDDLPDGMHEAASDLIEAVHAKNQAGVAHALHNAHSLSAAHLASKK
jgi:hypothetical protein